MFYRAIPSGSLTGPLECGHSFAGHRYNPKGVLTALYFSDDEMRSVKEAGFSKRSCKVYKLRISIDKVLDLNEKVIGALGLSAQGLTLADLSVPQKLGLTVFEAQLNGILFPSALPGAPSASRNLVLFPARLLEKPGIKVMSFRQI